MHTPATSKALELLKILNIDITLMDCNVSLLCYWQQNDPSLLISEISEEQIKDEITMETAIAERIKAGRKRAKKLKQRVAVR